jgi:hypothetical protein
MGRRDPEDIIASAVDRGAITPERAGYWRAVAAAGQDVSVLGQLATAYPPRRRAVYRDVAAAQPPPGVSPAWYAANPLLDELRASNPALVAAAMAEGPPPRLFVEFSADLPPFTASGVDPSVLAGMPWPVRRKAAEAPTPAGVYALATADEAALSAARFDHANAPYREAFAAWAIGQQQATGEPPARASAGGDYVVEALHKELFGQT